MLSCIRNKLLSVYADVFVKVSDFKSDVQGVTSIEYAIVVAGVAAIVSTIFGSQGTVYQTLSTVFSSIQSRTLAIITPGA